MGGVPARLSELGSWGLSNDEAWVALSTRVGGFHQFWLAISLTPVAWAGLVKLFSLAFGGGEAALRAVSLLFGCLTMWAAFVAGRRFAGHPLGGVLALAVVAFDPLSISYSRILKHYTAETFFCLLAIDRAAAFAESRARRDLVLLALVLVGGLGFANSQLFLAPPILAALLLDALLRRDRQSVRDVGILGVAVGVWFALYYLLMMAPRLPSASSDPYWRAQVYLSPSWDAARTGWTHLSWPLAAALGARGLAVGLLCLGVACVLRRQRVVGAALVLLVIELAVLSMMRAVPVSQPRILLFVTAAVATFCAAAVGLVVARAWRRPALGILATVALAGLALDFVLAHQWRALGKSILVQDAGPLVQRIERERQPGDTVVVHGNTTFIFAYYQRSTPVLDPVPTRAVSVGYVPRPEDQHTLFVNDQILDAALLAALRTSQRVWFVASRLRPSRERRIRELLSRAGTTALDERRPGAFLVLLTPRSPTPAGP